MKTRVAKRIVKRIAIQHVHVRINGESAISTEKVGPSAGSLMVVPFASAKKARRIMLMRGMLDQRVVSPDPYFDDVKIEDHPLAT